MAPGTIFTLGDKYRNCIRLNTAFWSERIEKALETLGGIAEKIAGSAAVPQEKKH